MSTFRMEISDCNDCIRSICISRLVFYLFTVVTFDLALVKTNLFCSEVSFVIFFDETLFISVSVI